MKHMLIFAIILMLAAPIAAFDAISSQCVAMSTMPIKHDDMGL